MMDVELPSMDQVREALAPLSLKQLDRLAQLSGVPVATIYKVKRAETTNPGIETLRKFLPHIKAARAEGAADAEVAA